VGEIGLASLCVDYLNLPAFLEPPTRDGVLNGDYGFMDYAVLYWIRHLEAGIGNSDDPGQLIGQLAESLEVFIDHHWSSPTISSTASKRIKEKLQSFTSFAFYDKLEQVVVSTRKQLSYFGKIKKEEIALDLIDTVGDVRKVLERIISSPVEDYIQKEIEQKYGVNLFKCPRFSCKFFTTGFSSAGERDKHIQKHDRPFQCTNETCAGFVLGFTSAAELKKHIANTHSKASQDQDFPTEQDILHSIQNNEPEEQPTTEVVEPMEVEPEPEEPEPLVPEPEPQRLPPRKRSRQKEFKCEYCAKVYTKRYNLQSHLLSHSAARPHQCGTCGKGFARLNDYRRHLNRHTGETSHACRGVLKNGQHWGCGKSFARADILGNHHKSKKGQACLLPLLREREQEDTPMQGSSMMQGSPDLEDDRTI
jgi:uncharacterized Zn-finger protein